MLVQAGLRIADIFAEAEHDAEFFGLNAVKAGHGPDRDRRRNPAKEKFPCK
ncbi:hypothetical protein GALL_385240 [mine drainage metagenome]|uniref:Uncharacterized protein n=1 Tax=mine drainage metagenome TaxID=410659 RepID=A0A1J5QIG1_9ZZZZ